ncbi:diguanylate cyclase (GGDEF) domain-containing protein [[Clostridium] aminophilum]|uniref:Diguanylate cyclase (GGDEF) domain-containing protein n=1 Tax=[Clostridium] aminophilum TaxID=1526 RepID=A0A1I0IPR9_9FIRM|nr:GGDEF domain-containing protein [[Clostridium] aminophilum]SET99165.1 diguanylate cyclase (GGDEF) domain-containing protein [[Clostridium] aminophilum]
MKETSGKSLQDFILESRIWLNHYLSSILRLIILTGPAIAIGIWAGIFRNATYRTCLNISGMVAVLTLIHYFLVLRFPKSRVTSFFSLTALDVIIVYMSLHQVDILITWFFVPLVSVLFCDEVIYFYAIAVNYLSMTGTTWAATSLYFTQSDFESQFDYFLNVMGGFTIEMLIMTVLGYTIIKLAQDNFRKLFQQNELIQFQKQSEQERVKILDSMAGIYDNVNLIDFTDNTEMALRDPEQKKIVIDMSSQTQTQMNRKIMEQVMPEQMEDFLSFTNITTVRQRLTGRKIISGDFVDIDKGWFRAQYIAVEAEPDQSPAVVIYTTRNVDEEKKREQTLIRISRTDEMTRLRNRRCYEMDLDELRHKPLEDDLVIFVIDVNGLKQVNDTLGHTVGDELIKGAAACLAITVNKVGRVYRTGGDEFMALVHTDDPEHIRERIHKNAYKWRGCYSRNMTMAVGYASVVENRQATLDELERIADADMYSEKEKYYQMTGNNRRRQ